MRDNSDWMLHPTLFRALNTRWGPFTVDLFATRLNKQLPTFFSMKEDPEAAAVDAFLQNWRVGAPYGNPPFAMIGAVLAKVEHDQATVALVLPEWRSAAWWPVLLRLLIEVPVRVPTRTDTFLPGHMGNDTGVGLPPWGVIACKVSGNFHSQQAFRLQLCAQHRSHGAPLREEHARRLGIDISDFAVTLESIPWPLLQ